MDYLSLTPKMEAALRSGWRKDVTWMPEQWHESNPALGCCGITAYAVQKMTGRPLRRALVHEARYTEPRWHYFNDGLDLTACQFQEGTHVGEGERMFIQDLLTNKWETDRAVKYYASVVRELRYAK